MSNGKFPNLDQLAALACLELSAEEKEGLTADMEAIVAFAAGLPAIDGDLVDGQTALDVSELREDVCLPCLSREEVLAPAHTKRDGYITVPRVWKEES